MRGVKGVRCGVGRRRGGGRRRTDMLGDLAHGVACRLLPLRLLLFLLLPPRRTHTGPEAGPTSGRGRLDAVRASSRRESPRETTQAARGEQRESYLRPKRLSAEVDPQHSARAMGRPRTVCSSSVPPPAPAASPRSSTSTCTTADTRPGSPPAADGPSASTRATACTSRMCTCEKSTFTNNSRACVH